jgi:hypothetical protein
MLIQESTLFERRHPAGLRIHHLVELDFDAGFGLNQSDAGFQAADGM